MSATPTPVVDRYAESAERFARDTAKHEMTVLHDDGLYRHLRFKAPGTGFYWFDLVTWPGHLSFTGDGYAFTFARVEDMFTFFRTGQPINPGYWAEKIVDGRERARTYSEDILRRLVTELIDEIAGKYPAGLREAVQEEILEDPDGMLAGEDGARELLNGFRFSMTHEAKAIRSAINSGRRTAASIASAGYLDGSVAEVTRVLAQMVADHLVTEDNGQHWLTPADRREFRFTDTWEWNLHDYDWWYLWACHAIQWGITQYDARRTTAATCVEATDA